MRSQYEPWVTKILFPLAFCLLQYVVHDDHILKVLFLLGTLLMEALQLQVFKFDPLLSPRQLRNLTPIWNPLQLQVIGVELIKNTIKFVDQSWLAFPLGVDADSEARHILFILLLSIELVRLEVSCEHLQAQPSLLV